MCSRCCSFLSDILNGTKDYNAIRYLYNTNSSSEGKILSSVTSTEIKSLDLAVTQVCYLFIILEFIWVKNLSNEL